MLVSASQLGVMGSGGGPSSLGVGPEVQECHFPYIMMVGPILRIIVIQEKSLLPLDIKRELYKKGGVGKELLVSPLKSQHYRKFSI